MEVITSWARVMANSRSFGDPGPQTFSSVGGGLPMGIVDAVRADELDIYAQIIITDCTWLRHRSTSMMVMAGVEALAAICGPCKSGLLPVTLRHVHQPWIIK